MLPMTIGFGASAPGGNAPMALAVTLDLERIAHSFARLMDDRAGSADGRVKVYNDAGRPLATCPLRDPAPAEPPTDSAIIAGVHGGFEFIAADGRLGCSATPARRRAAQSMPPRWSPM